MAIKTFTTGEVLTAADTNTYLANSGLVFVKSQTIGNGVSSVTVSDAFSSTYDNYRIVFGGGVASSASGQFNLKLGSSTTGYYGVLQYALYASGGNLVAQDNNASAFSYMANINVNQVAGSIDLLQPYLAKHTLVKDASWIASNACGTYCGIHQVATSYTDFTLIPNAGTITGGTITVYGYRKA
jgi:hypothetical protein